MTSPVWGHPYHGLVVDGILTLPNGAVMPYPVRYTPEFSPFAGQAFKVKRPLWPDLVRDSDSLAADALAGKQWRTEAVISGADYRLAGQPLDGWVYFAPDGARWWVKKAYSSVDTNINIRFELRSLGAPSEVGAAFIVDVAVGAGQSPVAGGDFTGLAAYQLGLTEVTNSTLEPAASVILQDIAPSGARAVYAVAFSRQKMTAGFASNFRLCVGFAEVRLTGGDRSTPPTVALVLLYDRGQALGQQTAQVSTGGAAVYAKPVTVTAKVSDEPTPGVAAAYPSPPYHYEKWTTTETVEFGGAYSDPNNFSGYSVSPHVMRRGVIDRVVSVLYDGDESPQPVYLNTEWGADVTPAENVSNSGARVARVVVDGNGNSVHQYDITNDIITMVDYSATALAFLKSTIRWGGFSSPGPEHIQQTDIQQLITRTAFVTDYGAYQRNTQLITPRGTGAGSYSTTAFNSVGAGQDWLGYLPVPMPLYADPRAFAAWVDWGGFKINSGGGVEQYGQRDFGLTGFVAGYAQRLLAITPQMFGWTIIGGPASTNGSATTIWHGALLSASGVDNRQATYALTGAWGNRWHLWASRDPFSGVVSRFNSKPVVYV